jgi:hypothetical protein
MGNSAASVQIVGSDPKAQETVQLNDGKLKVEVPAEMSCLTGTMRTVGRYSKPVYFKPIVDIAAGVSTFEMVTEDSKPALKYEMKDGRKFTVHNDQLMKILREGVKDRSPLGCYASAQ